MKRLPSAPFGMRAVSDLIQPEASGGRADDATGSAEIRSRGDREASPGPHPFGRIFERQRTTVAFRNLPAKGQTDSAPAGFGCVEGYEQVAGVHRQARTLVRDRHM